MRIPRIRLTIRLLMIAVAVVSLFLTGARLLYLRRHYQALAEIHASNEASYIRQAEALERRKVWFARAVTNANEQESTSVQDNSWERLATQASATAREQRRLAAQESRAKTQYQAAARRPWILISADPRDPE